MRCRKHNGPAGQAHAAVITMALQVRGCAVANTLSLQVRAYADVNTMALAGQGIRRGRIYSTPPLQLACAIASATTGHRPHVGARRSRRHRCNSLVASRQHQRTAGTRRGGTEVPPHIPCDPARSGARNAARTPDPCRYLAAFFHATTFTPFFPQTFAVKSFLYFFA